MKIVYEHPPQGVLVAPGNEIGRHLVVHAVEARAYTLTILADRPYVRISKPSGALCDLYPFAAVDTCADRDVCGVHGTWRSIPLEGGVQLLCESDSPVWNRKTYGFDCFEDHFRHWVEVEGTGTLDRCSYFSGPYSASLRWGAGKMWSGFAAERIWNPEPDGDEHPWRPIQERSVIDLTGVPIPGRDHWFFTPPPFCFVLEGRDASDTQRYMTLGIQAEPGQYRFTEVEWSGGRGQGLSLAFEGMTHVNGTYRLPSAVFQFGSDEYDALQAFCAASAGAPPAAIRPDWWSTPIFCGWGAQCTAAGPKKVPAPTLARQDFYEGLLDRLDAHDIHPGILVIDDKWQRHYGRNDIDTDKWPDLRGFVRKAHGKGMKVLLWLKAWDPEGLDSVLCIRDFGGRAIASDPTHPEGSRLLAEAIERLVSPEGLDADGVKIDFTARIPSTPGCTLHGDSWGLELMRDWLQTVSKAAKQAKPDALVMAHCPHPYLADVLDMIRLNDINTGSDINSAMTHRAKLTRAACPSLLVDTDNWPMPNKAAWLAYVELQPELGIPSLYYLEGIDNSGEPITGADLERVRAGWDRHRRNQGT